LATVEDLSDIERVAEEIAATMVDQRGGALFLRRESGGSAVERARVLLDDDQAVVLVGTYDDVIFGYAIGRVEELDDGGLLGRIDDLAVMAEAREAGIGEALMNQLVDVFTARNCFGVDSRALPGDRQTKNFFESFGLKARLLVVHRSLD
jgi:ribosomal protein S18 acetylase RimI-like enzyme